MKVKMLKKSDGTCLQIGKVYNAQYFGDERMIYVQWGEVKNQDKDVIMLSEWEHEWFEFV